MNEDEDQRKKTNMEDSTTTIDFLRARLLSERSVSRSARQRVDELAKRVVELEEQLKIVSLQRKKAEKATADVLAILETNGITDVSDEEYDSRSDQEGSLCESKLDNNSAEDDEAPPNEKIRRNHSGLFSGESSPLTGRSLSWRSGKNSSLSNDKKTYSGSSRRRRSSFASTGSSSAQHAAKSCRQIRRRETRSAVEELQIDTGVLALRSNGEASCSECFPNFSDMGADTSRVGSEDCEEKDLVDDERIRDTHYFNGHEGDKDMERALEHQAQLIGQFESEEKAQREWEEKFRENNSCTPDSFEAGNHSDVTEERDEIKASVLPSNSGAITFENQPNAGPADDVRFSKEEPKNKSSVPEMANENPNNQLPTSHISSLVDGSSSSSLHKGEEAFGSMKELALVPHGTSGKLESVLEALNQAKLSLKQNLNRHPLLERESNASAIIQQPSVSSVRPGDRLEEISVQRGTLNGLFRLPTDFQFEQTAQANNLLAPRFGSTLANYSMEPDHDKFFSRSYLESNSNTYSGDRFLSGHTFPYPEIESRGPTRTPRSDTGLPSSGRYPYLEPQLTTSLPSRFEPSLDGGVPSSGRYPYLDPRLSTTLPLSSRFDHGLDLGVPSSGRSPYLDHRSSTTLHSSRFDPGLDLGIPSSGRYTYQDPRVSAGTGIPSSSRFTYDPNDSFNKDMTMPRVQSDDRLLRSRDNGMMPPAAAQFSFYDHNTPDMYR